MKLEEILSVQTYSGDEWRMFAKIVRECKRIGASIKQDEVGNLYVTKGISKTYPCIVAHMDSVHVIVEDLSIISCNNRITGFNQVTMQQTGIGGDDKVGIYIALRCLEMYDHIKCAFFVNEEQGCIGSSQADMTFFKDCRFVLQGDRRGNTDFVVNASGVKLSDRKFKRDVKPILKDYGYAFSDGMMTDVMQLKENGLDVACANVSCGYYRPHAKDEYVVVSDVERCLELFTTIIERMTNVYKHKYERPSYYSHYKPEGRSWSQPSWTPTKREKYQTFWDDLETQRECGVGSSKKMDGRKDPIHYCDGCCEQTSFKDLTYCSDYNSFLCNRCYKILA